MKKTVDYKTPAPLIHKRFYSSVKENKFLYFHFTLNNYNENDCKTLLSLDGNIYELVCFGKELGDKNKIPHLQGAIAFKEPKELSYLKDNITLSNKMHTEGCSRLEFLGYIMYAAKDGDFYVRGGHHLDINLFRNINYILAELNRMVAKGYNRENMVEGLKKIPSIARLIVDEKDASENEVNEITENNIPFTSIEAAKFVKLKDGEKTIYRNLAKIKTEIFKEATNPNCDVDLQQLFLRWSETLNIGGYQSLLAFVYDSIKKEIIAGNITQDGVLTLNGERVITPTLHMFFLDRKHWVNDFFEKEMINRKRTFAPLVIWLYGRTGSGKSRFIRDFCKSQNFSLYTLPSYEKWFDSYSNVKHDVVLLDEFPGNRSLQFLLEMFDKGDFTVSRRNKKPLPFMSNFIFVTSSQPPDCYFYKEMRENQNLGQLFRRIFCFEMVSYEPINEIEELNKIEIKKGEDDFIFIPGGKKKLFSEERYEDIEFTWGDVLKTGVLVRKDYQIENNEILFDKEAEITMDKIKKLNEESNFIFWDGVLDYPLELFHKYKVGDEEFKSEFFDFLKSKRTREDLDFYMNKCPQVKGSHVSDFIEIFNEFGDQFNWKLKDAVILYFLQLRRYCYFRDVLKKDFETRYKNIAHDKYKAGILGQKEVEKELGIKNNSDNSSFDKGDVVDAKFSEAKKDKPMEQPQKKQYNHIDISEVANPENRTKPGELFYYPGFEDKVIIVDNKEKGKTIEKAYKYYPNKKPIANKAYLIAGIAYRFITDEKGENGKMYPIQNQIDYSYKGSDSHTMDENYFESGEINPNLKGDKFRMVDNNLNSVPKWLKPDQKYGPKGNNVLF